MKRIVITTAVLALACAGLGTAQAASGTLKVTGGGQIVTDGTKGAGDTIAFTAQDVDGDEGAAAKGQFQFNPRGVTTGSAAPVAKVHGVVDCLVYVAADGGTPGFARFGGFHRDEPGQRFLVDVTDNGQGAAATGADMIVFRPAGGSDCVVASDDDEPVYNLGRGNVKIHNAPGAESGQPEGKGGKPGSALSLR